MKTILWDEHLKPINNIMVLKQKSNFLTWFYLFNKQFKTFVLYHNVEL